jgi:hypothetical protein
VFDDLCFWIELIESRVKECIQYNRLFIYLIIIIYLSFFLFRVLQKTETSVAEAIIGEIKRKKASIPDIDWYGVQIFAYATHYDIFNKETDRYAVFG